MEGRFLVCCQSNCLQLCVYEFEGREAFLPGRFPNILLSSSSDSSPLKFADTLVMASLLAGSRSLASSSMIFFLPLRMSEGLASVPISRTLSGGLRDFHFEIHPILTLFPRLAVGNFTFKSPFLNVAFALSGSTLDGNVKCPVYRSKMTCF